MNIGIVGLGLIGGSIGRAAVKKTAHTVFAYDRDEYALTKGLLLNAYHSVLTRDNAQNLDLLIICVYPNGVEKIIDEYAPLMKKGAIIMDCVGVKREIFHTMSEKKELFPDLQFLGGHPMAGREFSGVEHSTSGLMEHSTCILVPIDTDIDALISVKSFFTEIGAEGVVVTSADEHDRIIAYTSQLAHVVSSAYVMAPSALSHYGFSAGSFRDMTRVARLNPDMWTQLMLENSDYLAEEIFAISDRLKEFGQAVSDKDGEKLRKLLSDGNERKLFVETRRAQKISDALHK